MEKKYIFLVLLLLTVGFASVNTIIDIKGKVNMSLLESDLEVIFKEVLLNKENNDKAFIIEEGKSFIYSSDELVNINQTSNIDYTIMNKSHQYDMEVKVSCTTDYKEYLSYTSETIDKSILIEAGEVVTGNIITELIKEKEFGNSLILKCTLYYVPVSRDTVVEEKEYIVSFDTGYDDSVEDIKAKYYEEYGSLPTLERKNYKFLGWYTSDDIKVENNSLVKIKANHILHAKWEYVCPYSVGQTWAFGYTGGQQKIDNVCDGKYKIETWGASGAGYSSYAGGCGAYATGTASINNVDTLYINVGGAGSTGKIGSSIYTAGGYNGGGDNSSSIYGYGSTGGGSTHVATASGVLANLSNQKGSVLIVAGGGGSGGQETTYIGYCYGGQAGGVSGMPGSYNPNRGSYTAGTGGTQSSGAAFGRGGGSSGWLGAGGGGFYGGTSGCGGGGGSSYIGNPLLTNKVMYCYNCTTSNAVSTKTISNTCASSSPTSNCSKLGHGYAKITYLG